VCSKPRSQALASDPELLYFACSVVRFIPRQAVGSMRSAHHVQEFIEQHTDISMSLEVLADLNRCAERVARKVARSAASSNLTVRQKTA
jgi:hypothetical protein